MGSSAIAHLLPHNPRHIFFTGRSQSSAQTVIASAPEPSKLTFVSMDMKSLASVKEAADKILQQTDRLDVVIASAGIMAVDADVTKDGWEVQFGVNHLGNAALILHLLHLLLKTAQLPRSDVRVVMLTSLGARGHPKGGIDFPTLNTPQKHLRFGTWGRYAQSKLANVLFAHHLARRYPQLTSLAIHPGVIDTGIVTNLGFWNWLFVKVTTPGQVITLEQGGVNAAWAATGKGVREKIAGREGAFWEPVGKGNKGTETFWDEALGKKLWEWTEEAVEVKGP